IGRIWRGTIRRGMQAVICKPDGTRENFKVTKLMTFKGLDRLDAEWAAAGDIIALSGAGSATVGDTICPIENPDPRAAIPIDQPRVILKEVDGVTHEPFEQVVVNCAEDYTGAVIQKLSQRGGELVSLKVDPQKQARMEWVVATRGLIGYRSEFLTDTRGTGT